MRTLKRELTYPLLHASLRREVINGASLLYTWAGRERALDPVVLMGHLDVVPVAPDAGAGWTPPPVAGDITRGDGWGRGAVDDKTGVVAIPEAVEKLVGEAFEPQRTIYLAFGHDEEVGGLGGARRIIETLAARGVQDFALVLDEGGILANGLVPGVRQPTALIGIAEKGYLNLQLTVNGVGGHSSTPPAETPIGILSRAIARLESNPFPARLDGPTRQMLDYLAPEMGLGSKVAVANLWLFRLLVERQLLARPQSAAALRTTMAPTMFQAGQRANVLPTEATAVLNVRIRPGETVDTVTARVREIVADERVKINRLGSARNPSPVSETDSAAFRAIGRTLRQVVPREDLVICPVVTVTGTDAWYYAQRTRAAYRLLPVMITPDDFRRVHGVDERVSVESLAASVRFFYRLIKNADGL
jgi:carboxypeptidase PM20D1